ncbi:unnamed protein product, partial [Meganyctiphanes norvegica]
MPIMEMKKMLVLLCVFLLTVFFVKPFLEDSISSLVVTMPELTDNLRAIQWGHQTQESMPWDAEVGIRFESRKATLDAACHAEPDDPPGHWHTDQHNTLYHLLYSKGLLVCINAKVGCTTMKQLMLALVGFDKVGKSGNVRVHNRENMKKISAR